MSRILQLSRALPSSLCPCHDNKGVFEDNFDATQLFCSKGATKQGLVYLATVLKQQAAPALSFPV